MTIAFFTNFINHHQVPVADELYAVYGADYTFIETTPMPDKFKKTGYPDFTARPYILQAWKDDSKYNEAVHLAKTVDVALFDGNESLPFEIARYKNQSKLLSFEVSERWCKKGCINYLSPRFIHWYYHYITTFRKCNIYKLCCSAYLPNDMYRVKAFKNRCYKWAYFTQTPVFDIESVISNRSVDKVRMMWCARFIKWKHPELPVMVAQELKEAGYNFEINMYGGGILLDDIKDLITKYNVGDVVHLRGNLPNNQILEKLKEHDLFIMTSDRNEGWGAVVNEALSNGCAVVGDEMVGSIPYLVQHGKNGRIYKTTDIGSLKEELIFYLNNNDILRANCKEAYRTMTEEWSPINAVKQLIYLIGFLGNTNNYNIKTGPCSKAYPIRNEKDN